MICLQVGEKSVLAKSSRRSGGMGKKTEGSGARGTERNRTARIKLSAQSAASGV
jgi:hypothetical protein